MSHLFAPYSLRGITLRNRIAVSPMCMYSCDDGFANDWHMVHLGSRAVGGAGLVICEATAVSAIGRISPEDLGLWKDEQIAPLARIVNFINEQGAAAGIQLAHAGRKGSTWRPGEGHGAVPIAQGGWQPEAPSELAFAENYATPAALDKSGIRKVIDEFVAAAKRSIAAGFQVIEVHAAHGYLLHQFLSPLSNRRTDEYGGAFDNRVRLVREVVQAVRAVWPQSLPLFVRISATDWAEGGWTIDDSVALAKLLREDGADLIDASSGGTLPAPAIPLGPGYQTKFAERIRHESNIATGAVGLITSPAQADQIIRNGQANIVLLARELLRDPYWPLHAAQSLGQSSTWPKQYLRAAPPGSATHAAFRQTK
ncbi:MAG TPA: NADH:flavin oxidoreductase/NADH oxidase [Rhodocyclaceae bacterium]|nr:NADH:flavin oxidoreductase/NADH oxidase [Rhodocyclaceae bacterium]